MCAGDTLSRCRKDIFAEPSSDMLLLPWHDTISGALFIIFAVSIQLLESPCSSVGDKICPYFQWEEQQQQQVSAWVTRPERLKGAKDEVKEARRAKRRPEGPQTRSWGPEGP